MVHDDTDLVRRSLQGEQDAFEALVRRYQDAVYGLAFHLTGDFADAQDIAQQTFVTAYLRLSQLRDPAKFVPWLNRITVNESISWLRRRQRAVQLQRKIAPGHLVPTPHQEFERKELDAAVRKALGSLSEKNRLAVTLYYIDGLSQREVGGFLGISTSAVENRISRARKQLREEMIGMMEDTFKENRLPNNFAEKVRKSLDKGNAARRKGNLGAALRYSDEALDALADVPESPEARRLRKDALWLKGEAVRFPLGADEVLKYHEQALELEEKEGDRDAYAGALHHLAYDYADAGQHKKAAEYRRKALEIYEEIGELAGQAEVWMSRANGALFSDPEEALKLYRKALDLCNQADENDYGSMCRAAIALLKEVGKSPGTEKLIMCTIASDVVEKVSDSLILIREPGFGRCRLRSDYKWEVAFRAGLLHSLKAGDSIIDYNFRVGDEQKMEDFSYTFNPLNATRTIESNSETVSVIAGMFGNCLKVRTVLTPGPGDDGTERNRRLNQANCGTKQAWFAPGIGPVKFIFDTADGIHVHIELAEYSVKDGNGDYFPLSEGNRWVYRWYGVDGKYVTKSSYEVAVQKGDRFYIDHYVYAYFSGSEEEYEALKENL